MDNFSIYYPFKGTRAAYVCLFWYNFSSAYWVNAEWDSLSTESMRSETPRQLSQRGMRLHVIWVNAEGTNIHEDFIIPRWLSWRGVSLCVDSVDMETHLALTQLTGSETLRQLSHRQMLKNLNKSANSSTKSKTGTKKSHASVPLIYFPKACWNQYSRILEHAENHFQRALNVTQQLNVLVLHWAKMFFMNFKMVAVFLVKP
jgi:hypothetical protein